jgi:hypothetical protein
LECIDSKPFPELRDEALYGFAGVVVNGVDLHTEASKAAVLFQLLTVFGALVGQNAFLEITGDRHPSRLFTLIVGDTATGAKGTSWGIIRALCGRADIPGYTEMFLDGVASGEGLIKKLEGDGNTALLFESEFARLLTSQKWDGSTLSSRLRSAWDGNDLSHDTMKGSVLKATNPHAVIIGHVTPDELVHKLGADLIANGYGNRFLYCCSRRSKEIHDTDDAALPDAILTVFASRFKNSVLRARALSGRARWFGPEASELFKATCKTLPRNDGTLGKLTQRDRPYILRLALTYALLDGTLEVNVDHVKAAAAIWDYSYQSALWMFGRGGISGTDVAIQFLRERLAEGPQRVAELNTLAKAEDIPARGLRTARERLGVRTFKADGAYFWELRRKSTANSSSSILLDTNAQTATPSAA